MPRTRGKTCPHDTLMCESSFQVHVSSAGILSQIQRQHPYAASAALHANTACIHLRLAKLMRRRQDLTRAECIQERAPQSSELNHASFPQTLECKYLGLLERAAGAQKVQLAYIWLIYQQMQPLSSTLLQVAFLCNKCICFVIDLPTYGLRLLQLLTLPQT